MGGLIDVFEHSVVFKTGVTETDLGLMTRIQDGLEAFARSPERFIDGLENSEVRVLEESPQGERLWRRLDFGNFAFEERIVVRKGTDFLENIAATDLFPASTFRIRIRRDEELGVCVSFAYRQDAQAWSQQTAEITRLRTQAWRAKDVGWLRKVLGNQDFDAYEKKQPMG